MSNLQWKWLQARVFLKLCEIASKLKMEKTVLYCANRGVRLAIEIAIIKLERGIDHE